MLSILIPTYNYDVSQLIENIHNQCKECKIDFEILINDDASKEIITSKNLEQKFDCCRVFIQQENIGRSRSRNFLVSKSKFSWILFLDSDVLPASENYIKLYLTHTKSRYHIINGGLRYYDFTPPKEELLRWKYGKEREAIDIEKRLTTPHKNSFLSSNLLIHKSVFDKVTYDESINKYGYEDLLFEKEVNKLNYNILQIDNTVYHLKLDTSEDFLNKFKQSLQNLSYLIKVGKLDYDDTKISRIYKKTKLPLLKQVVVLLFNIFEKKMYNHLKSSKTSLFVFDLYRIGYFTKKF